MRRLITVISIICTIGIIALIFTGCQAAGTTEIQKQDTAVQQPDTGKETSEQPPAEQETAEAKTDTEQIQQVTTDEQPQAADIVATDDNDSSIDKNPGTNTSSVHVAKTSTGTANATPTKATAQAKTSTSTKTAVQTKPSTQIKTATELENYLINLMLSQRKAQKLPSISRKKELDDAAAYMARTGNFPSNFDDKYGNASVFRIYIYTMQQSEVNERFAEHKNDTLKEATAYGSGYYQDKNALVLCFIQAQEKKQTEQPSPVQKPGDQDPGTGDQNSGGGQPTQPREGTPLFTPKPGRCLDIENYFRSIIKAPRDPELDEKALEYAKNSALSNGKAKNTLMKSDKYIIEFPNWGAPIDNEFKTIGLLTDGLKRNPVKYGVGAYATSTYVSIWIIEFFPYNP